jgi:hypothetical protein
MVVESIEQSIQPLLVSHMPESHAKIDLNETKRMVAHNEFLQKSTGIGIDVKTVVVHLLHRVNQLSQSDAKLDRIGNELQIFDQLRKCR